jgi:hypothetical protein
MPHFELNCGIPAIEQSFLIVPRGQERVTKRGQAPAKRLAVFGINAGELEFDNLLNGHGSATPYRANIPSRSRPQAVMRRLLERTSIISMISGRLDHTAFGSCDDVR